MRVGVRGCMWDLIFYPVQGAYGSFYPYNQIKNMKKLMTMIGTNCFQYLDDVIPTL